MKSDPINENGIFIFFLFLKQRKRALQSFEQTEKKYQVKHLRKRLAPETVCLFAYKVDVFMQLYVCLYRSFCLLGNFESDIRPMTM